MNDHMKLSDILLDELPEEHPWKGNIKGLVERLIANGVTIQKWIPVTKMVPESHVEEYEDFDGEKVYSVISDFVLGYTDHGQFVCVQHLVEDEKDYWIDDFGTEYTVTHWMPLPEKPK